MERLMCSYNLLATALLIRVYQGREQICIFPFWPGCIVLPFGISDGSSLIRFFFGGGERINRGHILFQLNSRGDVYFLSIFADAVNYCKFMLSLVHNNIVCMCQSILAYLNIIPYLLGLHHYKSYVPGYRYVHIV